jgi:hypothetical protein
MRFFQVVCCSLLGCSPTTGTLLGERPTPIDDDDATDDDDLGPAQESVLINELMSDNVATVFDETGAAPDWIELYNATDEDVELGGWTMSDDWTAAALHRLPDGLSIDAGDHLVLWADGSPEHGPRHLAFRLSRRGEGVGLFSPTGESTDWVEFPPLSRDTSWARVRDGWTDWREIEGGTPDSEN